ADFHDILSQLEVPYAAQSACTPGRPEPDRVCSDPRADRSIRAGGAEHSRHHGSDDL
ncbi:MAG: hypothetical protein AVDCRST_MAG26-1714, partial [uncultured Chloroflexia bacterium]